jgi:SAM-dependent methyltransferase
VPTVHRVSFQVPADAYARYMGRFAEPLAAATVARLAPRPGQEALDVGCGPGALTAALVDRLGVGAVHAVDPSASFVAAVRARWPALDVRVGVAEGLPFPEACVDVAVAQLVVHFMADPVAGLAEMGRVTRPGGVVSASVWDFAGSTGPVDVFWGVVHELDPAAAGERSLPGARAGHLVELATAAGLRRVEQDRVTVSSTFTSFDEWWHPFTLGVGPGGAYLAGLEDAERDRVRLACRDRLPPAPFEVAASAWTVTAVA